MSKKETGDEAEFYCNLTEEAQLYAARKYAIEHNETWPSSIITIWEAHDQLMFEYDLCFDRNGLCLNMGGSK
jgi:hypothetical protein